eukprot:Gb_29395 [translate_table: standard]
MRVVIHHRPSSPFLFSPFLPLHSSTPPSLSIRTENFSILRRRSCSLKLQRSISNRSGCRRGGAVVCMASASSATVPKPFRVLFVCLGNICRSPSAEAVFHDVVQKRGLTSMFKIDSAGTIDYHEGNPADPRMKAAAKKRGINITSISRPISPLDFKEFDLILAMDKQNRDDILESYEKWKVENSLPADARNKVKLMCTYCKQHKEIEVPDPYYGGPQGFEKVLDILEDACESLLDTILEKHFKDDCKGAN